MFKPSSEIPRDAQGESAGERTNRPGARAESPEVPKEEMTSDERRARLALALEHVNRKFGNALRKLAE